MKNTFAFALFAALVTVGCLGGSADSADATPTEGTGDVDVVEVAPTTAPVAEPAVVEGSGVVAPVVPVVPVDPALAPAAVPGTVDAVEGTGAPVSE